MELKNGHYTIQGIDVHAICGEFGTPLYVYDVAFIAGQVKKFRDAFSGLGAILIWSGLTRVPSL